MTAVITGGGSGIGLAIAHLLYPEYDLILVGRERNRLETARREFENVNRVEIYPLDVSDTTACIGFYEYLTRNSRRVDVLVNAAGFGTIGSFLHTGLLKEAGETDTNCRGVLNMMKIFLPDMVHRKQGMILNVASSAGYMPGSPGMAVYYATKSYVLSLTRSVQAEPEVKKSGVYIGALCPGPVDTEFSRKAGGGAGSNGGAAGISSETCARAAVRGMKRGKHLIIPGTLMKFTYPFAKILPARLLLWFAGKHQAGKLKNSN